MTKKLRLFLVDGFAVFYRSHFAFIRNPLINSRGENTGAIFGFTNSLFKILAEEKPDYIAVVFDTKEPTFRHKKFRDYKATREKMPEEMVAQYPRIIELVNAFRIPIIEKSGFEADDVIGTLATQAEKRNIETYMVTGDKDFMQLLSSLIRMYVIRAGKDVEIWNENTVLERYGFSPQQVIEFLALTGDKSDNVPGVKGIGDKTATELIQQFGNLENLYNNVDKILRIALHQKLVDGKENAFLSRELVTIERNVPIQLNLDAMKMEKANGQKLFSLFEQLEFRSLMDRLPEFVEEDTITTAEQTSSRTNYVLVNTREQINKLVKKLQGGDFFVFDTETTGLKAFDSRIIGISFCMKSPTAYYVPLNDPEAEFSEEEALSLLKPLLESTRVGKGGQNIKFDGLMLSHHDIQTRNMTFDTMVADYLLNPGSRQHNLTSLALTYLNYRMIPIENLIGARGKNQISMAEVDVKQVSHYTCEDADITFQLKELLEKELRKTGTYELFETVEMPLVSVLLEMEKNGVKIDTKLLNKMSTELDENLQILEKSIYEHVGNRFNLNSPQQLGKILFEEMEIHKDLGNRRPPKTATGQFSTAEQTLEKYANHPVVEKILDYRKLSKLKSTYVDALPQLISNKTGRLHTSFNQTVTATGRLSSSDPNLQNIPIRTDIGRRIRQAFIPGNPADYILSADYSQIELRMMAHLSGDTGLREAFRKGEDIHATTAAAIFNIPLNEVNADHRRKAKEVNFGIIYGISQYGLASRLGITGDEAQMIIDSYFQRFPRVNDYMTHTVTFALEHKYVTTILNRRRYLPEIESNNASVRQNAERMAINTTIQGSAADLIKLAMINIQRRMERENLQTKMILQVHDELVFEVRAAETERIRTLVKQEMENAIKLDVPIRVDMGLGKNWLEAH
jgi:DNA polymerase-1